MERWGVVCWDVKGGALGTHHLPAMSSTLVDRSPKRPDDTRSPKLPGRSPRRIARSPEAHSLLLLLLLLGLRARSPKLPTTRRSLKLPATTTTRSPKLPARFPNLPAARSPKHPTARSPKLPDNYNRSPKLPATTAMMMRSPTLPARSPTLPATTTRPPKLPATTASYDDEISHTPR